MVRRFHAAGIEVLLDVVYNHTAEGGHRGPTLVVPRHRQHRVLPARSGAPRSLPRLHRLRQHARPAARAGDSTSCSTACATGSRRCTSTASGSTSRPCSAGGIRRSIRPRRSSSACARDPVLSRREADRRAVGPGSGRVPGRRFPAGVGGVERQVPRRRAPVLARRHRRGRRAGVAPERAAATSTPPATAARSASVNFVTCHDGFTLHDLVSYEHKHNEANGEGNRDGTDYNLSRNWGVEGPATTTHSGARARARQAQPARDAGVLAGRADAVPRRRARPHPARQQQRLLPRRAAHLGPLGPRRRPGRRCCGSPGPCWPSARPRRRSAAAPFFPAEPAGAHGLTWLRAGRGADDARPTGPTSPITASACCSTTARRSCCCSTAAGGREPSRCPSSPRGPGPSWSTRPTKASARSRPALTLAPHSLVLLRHA